MSADFFDALNQIAREKEIPVDQLISTIEAALRSAYKRYIAGENAVNYARPGAEPDFRNSDADDVKVRVTVAKNGFRVYCEKTVVESPENPHTEISLVDARKQVESAEIGDAVEVEVTPAAFGRIAAQTAKQVVMQSIREEERKKIFGEYSEKIGKVLTGIVTRADARNVYVDLDKVEAVMPAAEQVEGETYRVDMKLKVYVLDVRSTTKNPQVIVSRTHPGLIRGLFELEVPEIADGIVRICSVAREAGARTKIAVQSLDSNVDAMGSCVGHRGLRVQAVVDELFGEKVDIIRWSEEPSRFISEALSPAKVTSCTADEETKTASVIVPAGQLSLAIGKAGQNVRLAARLTGWRIDIHPDNAPEPSGEEQ